MIEYSDDIDLTQPGPEVILGMPAAVYHALPRLNAGKVAAFAKSMLHGAAEVNRVSEPTMDMAFGTAVHARVLEPEDYMLRSVEFDIGPASRVKYAAACQDNPDKIVLAHDWSKRIEAIRDGIRRSKFAEKLMFESVDAHNEITILWTEQVHGRDIACKARLDFIDPARRIVADLKTTNNNEPGKFEKTIGDFGYHIKGAWYCRAASVAGLVEYPRMVWITCETSSPYSCQPFMAMERLMDQGWGEACVGLHRYAAWTGKQPDPAPPAELISVDLPMYRQIDPDTLAQFTGQHDLATA